MKASLYCLPPFFKFCPTTPPPWRIQLPPPLLFLLSYFFSWIGDNATFDAALSDIMDLYVSNFDTLLPERPYCVFYATKSQVYWFLTYAVFCWYSGLISYTHTNTHKHTQHTHGPIDWHNHTNIYQHHLLCAHSNYIKNLLFTMSFLFKNYSLAEVCWLDAIKLNSSCETPIILI